MTDPVLPSSPVAPAEALAGLLYDAGLPPDIARRATLTGAEPALPSSFAVGTAAQATIAAAALAADAVGDVRGQAPQPVAVDMRHAALECTGWFSLDGQAPDLWDTFSGLYRASDGWVRIHANFAHHRDGALRLLGLDPARADRAVAEAAMRRWRSIDFETAAAEAGLVATALRSFGEWDATPQAQAIAAQPLFTVRRIGDAPPRILPPLTAGARPLAGLRVLDLTRILAGPVGGKALATYGADVLLVNGPHLPNIAAIADTSRGKRSTLLDLREAGGRATLEHLLRDAHVFLHGYRPGGLAALGFGPERVADLCPGIVQASLTAYGTRGPWAGRRGFDSLVQTATGFNHAETKAAGSATPRTLPVQIFDEASGYLLALGCAAALVRQQQEGGSWHVQVSLAQTGHWLRGLGRIPDGFDGPPADEAALAPWLETSASGFGTLTAIRHSARWERTPTRPLQTSMPPGSHPPAWW